MRRVIMDPHGVYIYGMLSLSVYIYIYECVHTYTTLAKTATGTAGGQRQQSRQFAPDWTIATDSGPCTNASQSTRQKREASATQKLVKDTLSKDIRYT